VTGGGGVAAAALQRSAIAAVNVARVIAPVRITLALQCGEQKTQNAPVKYWQIVAAKLSARGFSWGCSSETDPNGRVLYTADAFSKDGKRFTVLAADKLTAFVELERQVLGQTSKLTWEMIADNLSKAGWSWGYVSAIDSQGRTIWIVDAHRNGKRFIVRAGEKLTAFLELESQLSDQLRWKIFSARPG
jgi:hypothetical protein